MPGMPVFQGSPGQLKAQIFVYDSSADQILPLESDSSGNLMVNGTVDLAAGAEVALAAGTAVGLTAGTEVGIATGAEVALVAGTAVGLTAGTEVGIATGAEVALVAGTAVGLTAGAEVALAAGSTVGLTAGTEVGIATGAEVALVAGTAVGLTAGAEVALAAGSTVGLTAGTEVGIATGAEVALVAGTAVGLTAGTEVGLASGAEVVLAAGTNLIGSVENSLVFTNYDAFNHASPALTSISIGSGATVNSVQEDISQASSYNWFIKNTGTTAANQNFSLMVQLSPDGTNWVDDTGTAITVPYNSAKMITVDNFLHYVRFVITGGSAATTAIGCFQTQR